MMIAAAHLRAGDEISPVPSSDEANFDVIYDGGVIPPGYAATIRDVQRRHPLDETASPPRRYVHLGDHVRCWDDTRLINVTQRNGS